MARASTFFKEFVIFFGFLNGVWLAVGVNPGAALWDVVVASVARLHPSAGILALLTLAPLVLFGVMLYLIHRKGGLLGILAVTVGFLGGALVTSAPASSLLLLLAAFGLGYVATR